MSYDSVDVMFNIMLLVLTFPLWFTCLIIVPLAMIWKVWAHFLRGVFHD